MDYVKILNDSGLKKEALAKKLCIGLNTVQAYLKGHRNIPEPMKKLIEHEFVNSVHDPSEAYHTNKSTSVDDLQEQIKLKDEIIAALRDQIDLLKGQNELLKFQRDHGNKSNGTEHS